ncbi:hypothetical protein LINPERHAP2_LOCUS25037 [Linum perenne]
MNLALPVGLVINLNDPSGSYYISKDEFKKEDILHFKYHKIGCCGLDAISNNMAVNEFVYQVIHFKSIPQYSEQHILVHCTHGHNCIGYMIVHYLMRTQFTSVTEVPLGDFFRDVLLGKRYPFKQINHQRFKGRKVIHFKSIPQYSEQHILVHCTDGHNCTVYMIVHYLMRTHVTSVIEVGLVIDLNDLSSSYYISKDEFKKESILHFKYHKIGCCGLDAIPSNMAVNEFVYQDRTGHRTGPANGSRVEVRPRSNHKNQYKIGNYINTKIL